MNEYKQCSVHFFYLDSLNEAEFEMCFIFDLGPYLCTVLYILSHILQDIFSRFESNTSANRLVLHFDFFFPQIS